MKKLNSFFREFYERSRVTIQLLKRKENSGSFLEKAPNIRTIIPKDYDPNVTFETIQRWRSNFDVPLFTGIR